MQNHDTDKENNQEALVDVHITLLDGGLEKFCLSDRCLGADLFALVIKKIGTFENEYFGLLYTDFEGNYCWIDNNKPLTKVIRNSSTRPLEFMFAVKFYTPYPNLLEDDLTRYLYALQIKNDFFKGLLHSNHNTSLLLAAFIAQSQLGDFQESECRSYAYLKKHHIFRTAPDSYLMRLMELHQTLIGITKSEADYRLLDAARKVELYGIRLHAAKNIEDKPVNLGVNHFGIMIFEKFSRVNTFNWSMIRKLSFKRRKLLLKLHMEAYGYGNDIIEFSFSTRNSCKNFWKKCIEQHTFFRSMSPYGNRKCGTINRSSAVFPHSFANFFSLPFGKLYRSASCGSNGILNSKPSIPKQNNGMNSDVFNTKSSQNSHLSTPVKQLGQTNLIDSNSHFSSEYTSSNPYFDDKTTSVRKKSNALIKLLSQQTPVTGVSGGGCDHIELFRLSFSSLIPYSSLSFDSNNIAGGVSTLPERSSFKWNCNRANSTSSIDRQVSSCRRKLSTHSYVPRHFSSTISRQSSASRDVNTLDWSDFKFSNQQSTFTNYNSKDSINMLKPSENASICSSSCSLTSESYPRPVSADNEPLDHTQFLLTPKSNLSKLFVCELDCSADEKDTSPVSVISTKQNVQIFTNQIRSPVEPSIQQLNETKGLKQHYIPVDEKYLFIEKEDYPTSLDNLEQYTYRTDNQPAVSPVHENNKHEEKDTDDNNGNGKNIEAITVNKRVEGDNISVDAYYLLNHYNSESMTFRQQSPSHVSLDHFKAFSDDDDDEDKVHVIKVNNDSSNNTESKNTEHIYKQKETVPVASVADSYPLNGKSHQNSIHNSSLALSEDVSLNDDYYDNNKENPPVASMTDIAQSELIDDLESDNTSDKLYNADEAPESLADAISLGAISLITGLSEDDDNENKSNEDNGVYLLDTNKRVVSDKHLSHLDSDHSTKGKHSKSLTILPRSKNIDKFKSSEISTKIESVSDLFRVKSQQLFSNYHTVRPSMDDDSSLPSALLLCNVSTSEFNVTLQMTQQQTSELLAITSGCLDIFKEILLTESMYNHDLEFLMTAPLYTANVFNATSLTNWLQTRLLPILKPIINKQRSFLHQLKITVSILKRLITRVKLLGKQLLLIKSKDNDKVESVSQNFAVDCESPLLVKCFDSSESFVSHIPPQFNEDEQLSSSEISSCNFSPYFKHKHKKYGLHLALKKLHSLTCCTNLFMSLLDQLQDYEIWIQNSTNLLSELWILAFFDVLSSFCNTDDTMTNNDVNTRNCSNTDDDKSVEHARSFIHSYLRLNNNNWKNLETSSISIRKVLYNLESQSSSIGSLWDYLLLPGRRFRSYSNLLRSLVNQLSTHSHSLLCKTVCGHYLLSNRSLNNTIDQTERVALTLHLSTIIFPLEKFLFTFNRCVSENLENTSNSFGPNTTSQNHNNSSNEQLHQNLTFEHDNGNVLIAISSFLLSSLTSYPIIRFGWLNKYSRRGFQPRVVFLFTDRLVYASRIRGVAGLYLKLHGIIALSDILLEKNIPQENQTNNDQVSDTNKQSICLKFGLVVTYSSHSPVHKSSDESHSHLVSRDTTIHYKNRYQIPKGMSQSHYILRKHRKRFIFGVQNELDYKAWINDIYKLSGSNRTNVAAFPSHLNGKTIPSDMLPFYKYADVTRSPDSCISDLIFAQVTQRCLASITTRYRQSESGDIQLNPEKSTSLIPIFQNDLVGYCWRHRTSLSFIKLLNTIDVGSIN
ncbi:FERM,ARHGEF and pleckstrin domain-containing protein isoform 3 [Schistosoma japonicum]|uniref:FERM,ARHGEF and pleckstrin domain-containing protein isoform 3 n=1 Tax=Schistosoma japonicum TaxID=6182 RepID=A0A4Z2D1M4_SCHJA|nr:FERM, ARHGEF and pleckstrin domain-containing protein 2 [Schistosoma japonicum]TNN10392.1 FERM,ARHGEF and pleckstrin domain-containing protein isoform 3 [Schistosoma japonicum]